MIATYQMFGKHGKTRKISDEVSNKYPWVVNCCLEKVVGISINLFLGKIPILIHPFRLRDRPHDFSVQPDLKKYSAESFN